MGDRDRALAADAAPGHSAQPEPASGLGPNGRVSHSANGPAAELDAIIGRLRGKVAPGLIAMLMPSLADAAYNAEYERKGLSAWESPEYRPYCLNCSTMRRMEHRDYGYQCSVCGSQCDAQGMSAFGQDPKGLEAKPASPVPQGGMRPDPVTDPIADPRNTPESKQ